MRHLIPISQREKSTPMAEVRIPPMPAVLEGDEAAVAEWQRVTPLLEHEGLIAELDAAPLAAYCMAYSRWQRAVAEVRTGGEMILAANGSPVQNPWLAIRDRAAKDVLTFGAQFGITPTARSKIRIPGWASQLDRGDPRKVRFLALGGISQLRARDRNALPAPHDGEADYNEQEQDKARFFAD
jgi:P27 family predicted phage terminase small subunit